MPAQKPGCSEPLIYPDVVQEVNRTVRVRDVLRAESPKDISPGHSESASDALGSSQHEQQALKGRKKVSIQSTVR